MLAMVEVSSSSRRAAYSDLAPRKDSPNLAHVTLIVMIACLNQISFGYDVGAVSQSLGDIKDAFALSSLQEGGITSALNFFAAFGALVVSGSLIDRYGRKHSLKLAAWLLVTGGVVVACAGSFGVLLAGRMPQRPSNIP